MIDSDKTPGIRLKRSTFLPVFSAVLIGLLAGDVEAQEAMPPGAEAQSPAQPQSQPQSLAPPITLFPDQPATGSTGGLAPVADDIIAVRQLDELSVDTIGLIDGFSGGLPVDMWDGSSLELVEILLPKLPAHVDSEVMRGLISRLLLTVARPPEPAPVQDIFVDMTAIVPSAIGFSPNQGEPGQGTTPEDLNNSAVDADGDDLGILERRLAQLAAMGDWASVEALTQLVPEPSVTEQIRIFRTDLALVLDRAEEVCAGIGDVLAMSSSPYWQKVFAYCQLREGNVSGAFLTIDLLRETGVEDPAFFWVAELMAGNRPLTPNGLDRLVPLELAMLRTAGRPFPPQLVRNGDPTLLRVLAEAELLYVAEDDDTEEVIAERVIEATELRLDAAERAVDLGALDPARLRELYRMYEEPSLEPDPDEKNDQSVTEVDEEEDVLDLRSIPVRSVTDRAKLFQLVEAQVIPTAQAEVISHAIDFARNDRGRNGPDVATMGMVYSPALKQINPTGDLAWFAGNAARALIASGELETGKRWLELSQLFARTSIEASDVAAAMWPVERQLLPSMTNRFTPVRFKRWEESRPSTRVAADKALVLTTLTSFDESVSMVDWMSLMDRRTHVSIDMPQPHIWNGLALAAENGRVGETVLLSLVALGEDGTAGNSPVLLARIIKSLIAVGLEEDARRLAVEAALVQGL